ncbi:MAG: YbgC/FadM family acyl-CoA thioesterase [Chitinispirillaceae bacterium]|jgi:acyl-CoA thioester hydrolase
MQLRVYYEDTDCGNVVYYANYLRFMERSRTELLRERGIDLGYFHKRGILFAVTEAHVYYKAPAVYNDLLDADSTVEELAAASMLFRTLIRRVGEKAVLVQGDVRVACISTAGRPMRIPEEIRSRVQPE